MQIDEAFHPIAPSFGETRRFGDFGPSRPFDFDCGSHDFARSMNRN
jgi:hypothetical protein